MDTYETQLLRKSQSGDTDAFEELIGNYEKKAYNIAYCIMGNEADAKDMTQEAFIRIYRSIAGFKGQSAFSTWMYRLVTNTCMDELQKRSKEKLVSIDETPIETIQYAHLRNTLYSCQSEEEYVRLEQIQTIWSAINELREEYRVAIVLRDVQGFSYDEISVILGCSMNNVKTWSSRGRSLLKDKLQKSPDLFPGKSLYLVKKRRRISAGTGDI